MKTPIQKCFAVIFVLLASSWTYASNNPPVPLDGFSGINKANIEKALAAPASELEYKTALEIKQMLAAPAPSQEALNAARSICYSSLVGNTDRSIIMVPLPSNFSDLDAVCRVTLNNAYWYAGGIAKSNYSTQDCKSLDNTYFGGGYTSYTTKATFEANRALYPNCGPTNAMICCSDQYPH